MKSFFNFLTNAFLIYMAIDVVAFMSWSLSGQTPASDFYFGIVTTTIIKTVASFF